VSKAAARTGSGALARRWPGSRLLAALPSDVSTENTREPVSQTAAQQRASLASRRACSGSRRQYPALRWAQTQRHARRPRGRLQRPGRPWSTTSSCGMPGVRAHTRTPHTDTHDQRHLSLGVLIVASDTDGWFPARTCQDLTPRCAGAGPKRVRLGAARGAAFGFAKRKSSPSISTGRNQVSHFLVCSSVRRGRHSGRPPSSSTKPKALLRSLFPPPRPLTPPASQPNRTFPAASFLSLPPTERRHQNRTLSISIYSGHNFYQCS
jgi:hypothetical protein